MNDYVSITFYKPPITFQMYAGNSDNWLWEVSYNVSLDEMYETVFML